MLSLWWSRSYESIGRTHKPSGRPKWSMLAVSRDVIALSLRHGRPNARSETRSGSSREPGSPGRSDDSPISHLLLDPYSPRDRWTPIFETKQNRGLLEPLVASPSFGGGRAQAILPRSREKAVACSSRLHGLSPKFQLSSPLHLAPGLRLCAQIEELLHDITQLFCDIHLRYHRPEYFLGPWAGVRALEWTMWRRKNTKLESPARLFRTTVGPWRRHAVYISFTCLGPG